MRRVHLGRGGAGQAKAPGRAGWVSAPAGNSAQPDWSMHHAGRMVNKAPVATDPCRGVKRLRGSVKALLLLLLLVLALAESHTRGNEVVVQPDVRHVCCCCCTAAACW